MTNTLQLTLSNDSVVNLLGADKFTYEAGGNSTAGINQTDVSYASFVQNTSDTRISSHILESDRLENKFFETYMKTFR